MTGRGRILLCFAVAAGILAVAGAALAWDGAYYLLLLVDREAPVIPFHRYAVLLLQAPAYLAQVLGLGLPVVKAAFSIVHAAVPAVALALSAWMVRGKREGLLLWAALGIGVATAPVQLFLVSEALQATQLAWPLALWVAAGMPRSRAPVALALALLLPLVHPVAVTLLGAIGLLAVGTAFRNRSRGMALVGLGILALALARYLPFPLKLDPQYLDTRRFTPHYHEAVKGLPMAALILVWAGAIALTAAGAGRVWTYLRRFGAALVVAAPVVLIVWAWRPATWVHALDYRTWVALLSLPLFAVAGLEGLIRRGPIELDRFRAAVATAVGVGFVAVIGVQAYVWTGLWNRLEDEIARAPGACLAVDREVPWIEDTALSHWGIVSQAVLIQGRAPTTLVVRKAADCAVPRFDEVVPITPWDHRPRQGGWFDFRLAGRGAGSTGTVAGTPAAGAGTGPPGRSPDAPRARRRSRRLSTGRFLALSPTRPDHARVGNRRKVDRGERVRAAKATARRTASVLGKLLLVSALVGGTGWGLRALWVFATTSPRFAIETIELSGHERAEEEELRGLLGIEPGENLFLADTGSARERLLSHPWVREARVVRRFPQGIAVTVLERKPKALVDLGHLYLLDEKDEVFKRALPGDPADLPVITGVTREEWTERTREARERLRDAVALLDAVERRPGLAGLPAAEVHLDEAEGSTLYLGDAETAVKLGHDGIEAKLDRLERVLGELEKRGEEAELLRLDNRTRPGWIAARRKISGGTGAGSAGAVRRGNAAAP